MDKTFSKDSVAWEIAQEVLFVPKGVTTHLANGENYHGPVLLLGPQRWNLISQPKTETYEPFSS